MASKDLNQQESSCVVMYRECWRNHAVLIGGYAADGCGEFIPKSNQEGTKEALLCEACGCHRNFHRKEVMMKNGQTILGSHHLGPNFNWRSQSNHNFDSISSSCSSSFNNEVSDEESVVCSGNYYYKESNNNNKGRRIPKKV